MNAGAAEASSSPDLSSPPQSPEAPSGDNSGPNNGHPSSTSNNHGGALSSLSAHAASPASNATPQPATKTVPVPTKRQRKKKDPVLQDASAPLSEEKPKRQRKTRDPNAPPVSRKRKKADASNGNEEKTTPAKANAKIQQQEQQQSQPPLQPLQSQPHSQLPAQTHALPSKEPGPAPSRQSKITDLINQATSHQQVQPAPQAHQAPSPIPHTIIAPTPRPQPIIAADVPRNQTLASITGPTTPRPASSGQVFDPVRSATVEPRPIHSASAGPPVSPPAKFPNRASASPSINSLIDPIPMERSLTASTLSQTARYQPPLAPTSAPVSPAMPIRSTTAAVSANIAPLQPPQPAAIAYPTAMDVDSEKEAPKKTSIPMKKSDSTGASNPSAAPTPPIKPTKPKDAPPPLPGTGSGLLSGTPLGPTLSGSNAAGNAANIWLTFPLKGQKNITINFAREVEKKYGFAALHPRIAAQKERRRQVALAGAALEKASGTNSADEMSLDLSEPESNVEMGGVDEDGSTAGGTKRKRRKRVDEYDKDDDFIDDTELAWEQQALMAKDGFFVYSGPLVTEGEKPPIERADGTVRRGRGRGRGGTARGAAASGESSGRGGRGGGRGSRGGTTVRKPRVTKADRAMMEQEKHEREKMAATLAAKPGQVFQAGAATA